MAEKPKTVALYRIENPNLTPHPDSVGYTSHPDLVGQWFSPNLPSVLTYLRKSTQTFGPNAHTVDGAQLLVAEVPADQLDAFHVSNNPVASQLDVENDNYILPRDASIPMDAIPLDPLIGDLRGKLARRENLVEAGVRIGQALGHLSLSKS